jgi:ribose 5-phosphate isomerase B
MQVAIASDHAGFCQKAAMIAHVEALGHNVIDAGPHDEGRVDYPDYAQKVAHLVASGEADRGILICGTGIGMAVAANKIPGVRAACIQTPEFARLFREHNDGNVLCLSGRFISEVNNREIISVFLEQEFSAGRHAVRVDKITALETCER